MAKLSKIQNKKKRIKVRLASNALDYKKYMSKPSFVSQKLFNYSFFAIHEIKPVLSFDRPIYVGFSILDISKFRVSSNPGNPGIPEKHLNFDFGPGKGP